MEAAKKLLIIFFETRKKHPQIFENRDISSKEFRAAIRQFQIVGLKPTTKDNHKITVFRLTTADSTDFVYLHLVRLIVAMLDSRFIYCDPNDLLNGEVGICDVSNFTFGHFMKIISSIGTMKAYMSYAQESAPIRIVQNHFVNCGSIMNKMMAVLRPFMRKEIWESTKFHSTFESLHEYIPKEILPVEFGGTAGKIDDLYDEVLEYFESCRDYLMDDDNWKLED